MRAAGFLWNSAKEVFGKTSHYESYAYTVVADHSTWQHRRYSKAIAAETDCGDDDNKGFMRLARYIGVFSDPENTRRDPVAMTTPVVNTTAASEPIAMTTPVVNAAAGGRETLRFVLPSAYRSVDDVPSPTDTRVRIVEVPAKDVAALRFNGWCAGTTAATARYRELAALIEGHGLKPAGAWELHRFNPPYTLGPLRTNEVVVPVTVHNATGVPSRL